MQILGRRVGRLVAVAVCSSAMVGLSVGAATMATAQEESSSNPCVNTPTEQTLPGVGNGATPADAPGGTDTNQDPCGGPPGSRNTIPTYTPSPTTTTTPAPPAAVPAAIKVAPAFTG
jgi:hypothetical protein